MRVFLHMIILVACFCLPGQLQAQKTALLLIDIQEFYFPGGSLQLEKPEQAGMNAGLLLEEFDCILIEDACATRSLQYEEHIIPASNVHFSSIITLLCYAKVMSTAGFLNKNTIE